MQIFLAYLLLPGETFGQNVHDADNPRRGPLVAAEGQGSRLWDGLGDHSANIQPVLLVGLQHVVERAIAPAGHIQAVGIAAQLVHMQGPPLGPRESREQTAVTSGNLQHQCDAEGGGRLLDQFVVRVLFPLHLLDLVEDGVADAFHEAVRRVRRNLALDNEDPRLLRCCSSGGGDMVAALVHP